MSMTDDDITRAARTMIPVDPPQDLEARIKRKLDRELPRAQPRWRPAYWIGAAGLSAAALLSLLVVQGSLDVTKSRGPEAPVVPMSRSSEVPESAGPAISSSAHLPISSPIRLPAYRSISESEWAWMSRRVPALELIEPIQPEAVAITPLTITPLTSSPISGDPDEGRQ